MGEEQFGRRTRSGFRDASPRYGMAVYLAPPPKVRPNKNKKRRKKAKR